MHRRLVNAASRFVTFCAVASFLAGTIGVPMPRLIRSGKDLSQPYPCRDHACGCASAEQCWRSCCCFTNREKLAWAEEHHVTPPAFVLVAAARETMKKTAATCCASKVAQSDCHHDSDCDHHASCSKCGSPPHADHDADNEEVAQPKLTIDFVLAVQARRCQGQAQLWLSLGAVTAPPAKIELKLEHLVCANVENVPQSLAGISLPPATPPPRA